MLRLGELGVCVWWWGVIKVGIAWSEVHTLLPGQGTFIQEVHTGVWPQVDPEVSFCPLLTV